MSWDKDNGKMAKEAAIAANEATEQMIALIAAGGGGGGGGGKGDPFTYDDFTPAQLESLKGPQGPNGKTWHITATTPANSLGVIGDMHLNTVTYDISEKTATSIWTVRGNIKGTAGTNGKTWLTGTVTPTNDVGTVGDLYLNTSTWDIHEKTTTSVWTLRGNIKGAPGSGGSGGSGVSSVKRYATIAEMKSDATLTDNDLAFTLGYRSLGDGGGATYRIGASASVEDAGSVFVLGNGKRAFLISNLNDINVKQFGAYGDGVTDDITFINNAITFLSSRGGGTLRFDGGTYSISAGITVKSNVTLLGIPNKTTILTRTNTFDAIKYDTNVINSEVNGLILRPTGGISESSKNAGVYFGSNRILINCNLRNLTIESFYTGIDVVNFWKASIVENVHILNCDTGINVDQTVSGDVSTITFLNVFIENPEYRALKIKYVEGFAFIGCRIQCDGTIGDCLDAIGCRGISFNSCRFDGMDSTTASAAMFKCSEKGVVTFDNCHFIDYLSTGTNSSIFAVSTGGKMSLNACSFDEIYSSSFTNTFSVSSNSRISYSNCADMSTLPPNYVSSTGFLIDIDSALTKAATLN